MMGNPLLRPRREFVVLRAEGALCTSVNERICVNGRTNSLGGRGIQSFSRSCLRTFVFER